MSILVLRADRPEAARTAENAVTDAERVASAIWKLAENIAQVAGKSGAGDSARERLYVALDVPYRRWLVTLVSGRDTDEARAEWQRLIAAVTNPIVAELISSAPPSAWVGRRVGSQLVNVAVAEAWFNTALRRAVPLAQHRSRNTTSEEAPL